jgi:glycosyltransferase involved in cell wall biosynthesis
VRLLPPLRWQDVPGFLAGAAVTIISTTSPESWCNAAAEALSAGTPVIGYDFGHVPVLTGPAGVMVAPGQPPRALWAAATRLLADPGAYHAAATTAPGQVRPHTPAAAAAAFLSAVNGTPAEHP